jgi:hypothetical protein
MPTLDLDLKDFQTLTHNAIASTQRKIELLAGAHNDDESDEEHFQATRDLMLDIGAEQLTLYKLTVLAAKRANTAGEVAEIWNGATAFFDKVINIWLTLRLMLAENDPETNALSEHYQKAAARLKELSQDNYRFHAE